MVFGYNTNGFAFHRLEDALRVLRDLGYSGVGLTLDYHHLEPGDAKRARDIGALIRDLGLGTVVVETGARFLLDPWRKHQPTLISPTPAERQKRADFLKQSIDLCPVLGSDIVSFWSGTPLSDESRVVLMDRLAAEVMALCEYAAGRGVRVAFEPEPGMLVATMVDYAQLAERVDHPSFGLTLDVGHLVCEQELPVSDYVRRWKDRLWNVHIEDMRPGVHDHVMFGEGGVDFGDVFAGLRAAGYAGGVFVELSRHSHDAVNTARKSLEFLRAQHP